MPIDCCVAMIFACAVQMSNQEYCERPDERNDVVLCAYPYPWVPHGTRTKGLALA